MRSYILGSGLAIVLGVITPVVSAIVFPDVVIAQTVKEKKKEADRLLQAGFDNYNNRDYSSAEKYFQQALTIYHTIQDQQKQGKVLFNLAKLNAILKQYEKAAEYYEQALPIYRNSDAGIAEILFNLGDVYSAMGKYEKAIFYYEDLLGAYEQFPDMMRAESHAGLLIQLGNSYRGLSNHEKADKYHQQANDLLNRTGRDEGIELISELGSFFYQNNQPELAIALYKKAVNGHEAVRRRLLVRNPDGLPFPMRLSNQQSRLVRDSYTLSVSPTYRKLADLLLQQNRIIEAMQVLDRLKVQDLQDFLPNVSSNPYTSETIDLLPEEKRILHHVDVLTVIELEPAIWMWKDFTANKNGDTFTSQGRKIDSKELAYLKALQQRQRNAINKFPENSAIKSTIEALKNTASDKILQQKDYQDLQTRIRKLGKNVALFYPLILDDRLELVILTNDRPPIHKPVPISRKQLETEVTGFRNQLQNRSRIIKEPAQKLYQSFIQPIEAELKAAGVDTIVYAPDDIMRYVPLAALHDGKQWLAERYQINYLTALALTPLEPDLNKTPKVLAAALTEAHQVKVLGQTVNFPALQFTQPEIETLAKTLPNTTTLINQSFSRQNLTTGIPKNTILHLATHGMFVPNSPDQSIIVMGDGSTISLREIEQQWKLPNVSLVVLSACETAIGGKLGNGIEILGFGYQMQRIGSRASISSLWTIDDGGTQGFMNTFYTTLKQGKTPAAAIQQTQRAFIQGKITPKDIQNLRASGRPPIPDGIPADLTHPFYWAPFILIGNGL